MEYKVQLACNTFSINRLSIHQCLNHHQVTSHTPILIILALNVSAVFCIMLRTLYSSFCTQQNATTNWGELLQHFPASKFWATLCASTKNYGHNCALSTLEQNQVFKQYQSRFSRESQQRSRVKEYLADDRRLISSVSDQRQLSSSTSGVLYVPRTRTCIGTRSFSVIGIVTWNDLPLELRCMNSSVESFAKKLKTYLMSI